MAVPLPDLNLDVQTGDIDTSSTSTGAQGDTSYNYTPGITPVQIVLVGALFFGFLYFKNKKK